MVRGRVPDVFEALHRALGGFEGLWSHEETGIDVTFARDRRVAAWCRERGVTWTEFPQFGVFRPHHGRDGWAARRETFIRQPQVQVAGLRFVENIASDPLPDAGGLGLHDSCPHRQAGGHQGVLHAVGHPVFAADDLERSDAEYAEDDYENLYDFLKRFVGRLEPEQRAVLREAAGEQTESLGRWWTLYQDASEEQRRKMIKELNGDKPGSAKRPRPRKRRKPRTQAD